MTIPLRLLGALFAVALVATACGGSTATNTAPTTTSPDDTAAQDDEHSDHDDGDDSHGEEGHGEEGHGAKTIDITNGAPVPEVAIELTETATPGTFDLVVSLTNFTITPENVDGDPIDNEGHMHLLIDGEKIERFTDLELEVMVPEGDHLVEVELNANNHAAYAIDGVAIRAGQTVTGHGATVPDDTDGTAEAAAPSDDSHSHGEAGSGIEDGLALGDATVSRTATYTAGSVELDGDDRIEASVGDIVMVIVNSDVAEQAHLHGYDVLIDVEAGTPATFLFTADTPGKFEIEFEQSGTFIAELVVS